MVSLAQLQEVPPKSMILLAGAPGSGKSIFCHQAILKNLAVDRPIIYVTTECGPSEARKLLREAGLGEIEPDLLNFVDAYNETVGLSIPDRPDTVHADCANLSSIGVAISKLQDRIGKKGVLLVFDSLVSPYLLSGPEVVRFMRLTLARFVAEGNGILACMDEGCGKQEDLGAMMSLSNGVMKMDVEEGKRILNVVKHPIVGSTRIEVPTTKILERMYDEFFNIWDRETLRRFIKAQQSGALRREFGQLVVNGFWPSFAKWSSIVWDPKRFPRMLYEISLESGSSSEGIFELFPWYIKLYFKLFFPKSFSKVKDMKKMSKLLDQLFVKPRRFGIMEYLDDISKTDEHYFRVYEWYECWGFENVGAAIASWLPPVVAGACKALEKKEREWNAVETKCIGLGDPYCEFKVVPGEIDELKKSLEAIDGTIIERIHCHLMDRLIGFMLFGKPLWERPRLGSDVLMAGMELGVFPMASERYRMAMRMGGTKSGKEVGERLLDAGMGEDEAVKHLLHLLEHCKVGKVTVDETIRIKENYESLSYFTTKLENISCFFTTGFLNGFFSAVKNQYVKEVKCIAMGDPYCEWEFR
jgi:predicted hydrocarbon binding protein/KaiC/GvpD/RAD55 family RecA-like ATPase